MQRSVLERFRRALSARKESVLTWLSSNPEARERCLGGSQEGEICIVDELDGALECTETGEFGQCQRCDGEVEVELLRADFTTRICLSCYSDGELRILERDLELAARVQQQLFPRFVPALDGVEIAAHVKPARFVGGDYYDFFPFADNTQGAVVADVMGKGLAASMLMSNLQASIRILGPTYEDPAELLHRLNELFRYNVSMTGFISILVIKIDPDRECLRYASAGHNPALMWRSADGRVDRMGPTGPAVGLVHEPDYVSKVIRFAPGDLLVMYTDGVTETRDENGLEFGVSGIEAVVRERNSRSAVELVDDVRSMVEDHSGGQANDDTTLLVIKRSALESGQAFARLRARAIDARLSLADGGVAQ
ncbi:MAG: PP2C family protein-serine/threonine phosphatase [Rhodothermales bacterium]|nr:PP2C family protein-serine/threonine phosphatase [Rhodothermales bacterium]